MSEYRLRQGHHDPRNLWRHHVDETPESKSGIGVGRVDSAALAAEIVAAVNARRDAVTARDADRATRTEQVEQIIREWFAQTYGDETPAPRLLVEGIRGHLAGLVGDELIRLDTQIAGLQAELEQARDDLAAAKSFAWTANGSLVRVTRVSDTSDGWVVDIEDQTVATGLDRESALARAREFASEESQ